MRSHSARRGPTKGLPEIYELDIRKGKVMVLEAKKPEKDAPPRKYPELEQVERDGYILYITSYKQLSGGIIKQQGESAALFGRTDKKAVEARAKYFLGRKMVSAFRKKNSIIRMKPQP
jgi:hypothetical protein